MKNIVIGVLLVATVTFGSLYVRQNRKTGEAQTTVASLNQKVTELEAGLARQEKQTARLHDRLEDARAAVFTSTNDAAGPQPPALTNGLQAEASASAQTNQESNPFEEIFKNPDMKEMIKTQQKTALTGIIDKNYAKLIADLHLNPEQTAALKEAIMNKMLAGTEIGMSMLSGGVDAAKRDELVQQIKTQNEASDAQIKQLLGDDNYTQYQAYEKTLPDRMAISSLKDQLAGGPTALNPDQEQQLIDAMSQERQNFKFTTDFTDDSKLTGNLASYFTEDKMNQFFQEQDRLNQQYTTRAQSILSPDQLGAFQKYLASQQAIQKAGMKMAAQLFAPKSGGK